MSSNQYLRDFASQLHDRFTIDSDQMSYTDWVQHNTTMNRRPYSIKGYEFQRAILDDTSRNLAVIKPSQVGATEVQMRKTLAFAARNQGTSIIFTLPNDDMFRRLSQTRVLPLVNANKAFNPPGVDKPVRRADLIQIGNSYIYFVGNSEGAATSIPADVLMHDEVDLSDQEMLALFQSRLQNSDWKLTQNFSTPTFESFGIDALYSVSDQHEYLLRCEACNHRNLPEWSPKHIHFDGVSGDINDFLDIDEDMETRIDFSKSYVFCTRCHKPLDLGNPELREWVPRYPGRRNRGYRITPFATPRIGIEYILDQQNKFARRDALRRFRNTVLGQPDNSSNARLTETEIRAQMEGPSVPTITKDTPISIGIDVGLTCHLVLIALTPQRPVAFYWEQVPEHQLVNRVRELLDTYRIVGGGIDRYPYTPLSNEIRDLSNNLIMPMEYGQANVTLTMMKDELGQPSHVRGGRTMMVDDVATSIRKGQMGLAGYGPHDALIVQHLRAMVRDEREDGTAVWIKSAEPDHYFHALIYGKFAIRVHNLRLAQDNDLGSWFGAMNVSIGSPNDDTIGLRPRRGASISDLSI